MHTASLVCFDMESQMDRMRGSGDRPGHSFAQLLAPQEWKAVGRGFCTDTDSWKTSRQRRCFWTWVPCSQLCWEMRWRQGLWLSGCFDGDLCQEICAPLRALWENCRALQLFQAGAHKLVFLRHLLFSWAYSISPHPGLKIACIQSRCRAEQQWIAPSRCLHGKETAEFPREVWDTSAPSSSPPSSDRRCDERPWAELTI